MADEMFLKIDGIKGSVTNKGYEGELEITSFSWGEARSESTPGAAETVELHDISFVAPFSQASPLLAQAGATGQSIDLATFTALHDTAKGNPVKYLVIKIYEALISSYSFQGSEANGRASEHFTFNFEKVTISYYKPQSPTPITAVITKLELP
jgi:type VI secretion system Hcp family effector